MRHGLVAYLPAVVCFAWAVALAFDGVSVLGGVLFRVSLGLALALHVYAVGAAKR